MGQAADLREEGTNRGAGGLEGRGSGSGTQMSRLHTCTDRDGGGVSKCGTGTSLHPLHTTPHLHKLVFCIFRPLLPHRGRKRL